MTCSPAPPWRNLGFFYGVAGMDYSGDVIRLGATDDLDGVIKLDGQGAR
ncbi:hypothetical protein ACLBYD_25915 [Rhodococcus sp. C26F]